MGEDSEVQLTRSRRPIAVSHTDTFWATFNEYNSHCIGQIRLDFSGLLPRECSWRMCFMDSLSLEKTKFEDKADYDCVFQGLDARACALTSWAHTRRS